jgi:hypothetical protein
MSGENWGQKIAGEWPNNFMDWGGELCAEVHCYDCNSNELNVVCGLEKTAFKCTKCGLEFEIGMRHCKPGEFEKEETEALE